MIFWSFTYSDFPINQTFHQFNDLDTDFDLHRIMSGSHGAFATGVVCKQGTLTLPDTWIRHPILGFACASIVETKFLELAMSSLDFSPRINPCTLDFASWLAEQELRGSIPGLAATISEIYILLPSRDMAEIPLKAT